MDNSNVEEKCRVYCNICLDEYPCKCKSLSEGVIFSKDNPIQFKRIVKIDKIFGSK